MLFLMIRTWIAVPVQCFNSLSHGWHSGWSSHHKPVTERNFFMANLSFNGHGPASTEGSMICFTKRCYENCIFILSNSMNKRMNINITAETERLHGVIVHTTGREVSLVNPEHKDELLFDDIIFEEVARQEHLNMLEVFKAAMADRKGVFEILDLARECFESEDVRGEFVEWMEEELPFENLHTIRKELIDMDARSLVTFVSKGTVDGKFTLHPAPNLLFTRDLATVAGNHIILSRAAKKPRAREFLLMRSIVKHHPLFSEVKENVISIGRDQSLEGGDVLIPAPGIVLIGMSERTSFSGLMSVA